ncbi:hypothetical protein BS47DRAFT_50364 [Hydnum rufescens UP504]|uniref:Uncharacterized protein n=1 Tax=Hydnum rufescens UP504 TaxID=1448309 RepID=A0A9P6ARG6_9AGAM|nr:hypothetical protein BS47DRAFT_50364 [Hydnum rufescens UP504]
MPGNLSQIPVSDQTKSNLRLVLPSISYLWNRRNSSIGLPLGHNGTTLFSTLATPAQGNVFFEDPYAQSTVIQCGSGADSPHNEYNITYTVEFTEMRCLCWTFGCCSQYPKILQ